MRLSESKLRRIIRKAIKDVSILRENVSWQSIDAQLGEKETTTQFDEELYQIADAEYDYDYYHTRATNYVERWVSNLPDVAVDGSQIDKEAIKAWALKIALGSGDIDNDDTGYWSLDAENWGGK